MRNLRNAIAVLLVLLATGSAVALAAEPAAAPATGPAVAPATEPAAAIEITYSYSNDPSTAKPLNGALIHSPFYIFFDPGLPDDTIEALLRIDGGFFPVARSTTPPLFSMHYDPSKLDHGTHHASVQYEMTDAQGNRSGYVHADFWYGI